jgi:uncharacterized protein
MLALSLFLALQPTLIQPPAWPTLKAAYHQKGANPFTLIQPEGKGDIALITDRKKITVGLLYEPKSPGKHPLILLLHGLGGNKMDMCSHLAEPLVQKGCFVLALDAPEHGARKTKEGDDTLVSMYLAASQFKPGNLMDQIHQADPHDTYSTFLAKIVHDGVVDYRWALDLVTRDPRIDSKHVGLVGYSMGSIMGSILAGVDHRIHFAALGVPGDPLPPLIPFLGPELQGRAGMICSSYYIGHAQADFSFYGGSKDSVIPADATKRLYSAAPNPKEIHWYPSGHMLPEQAFLDALGWVDAEMVK